MTGITDRVYFIIQMDNLTETAVELQKIPCLSGLSEEVIDTLAQSAELRTYSRNDTVFEESEPVESFFIVRKGSIKLCKTSDEGREFIVKVIKEGDHFCFVPVFVRSTHQVSSIAAEDSILVTIPADVFRKVLAKNIGPMGIRIIE
ncbi:MAG: cyclic nucleotide-binding domain-containing protein, partial [Nitrospirota bacterium]